MTWHGGCACGAIRYEVAGPAFHRTLCHCADCRRASGAPFVAWFSVTAAQLRFTAGSPALRRSSPPVERGYCARCGTQLTYRHDEGGDEVGITTASLDDPELAPPQDHTVVALRLGWVRPADGLPAYPHLRPGGGGSGK